VNTTVVTSAQIDDRPQPRKLVLKKETLRQLSRGELKLIAGGGKVSMNCDSEEPVCTMIK
jgi:hypothetical protein